MTAPSVSAGGAERLRVLAAALLAAVLVLGSAAIESCAVFEPEAAPFILSAPVCTIGENRPWWIAAGISFDFLNVSDREVQGMTVECRIYDADTGSNPFTGSNLIGVRFSGVIPARTKASLALALDPYLSSIPDAPFLVDRLAIRTIEYSDGSAWIDAEQQFVQFITEGAIQ